jgi:hypothetical protein
MPAPCEAVALREVVGAIEDYQPAVAMTERAIATDPASMKLARELEKLRNSRTVLNRRLREAVLAALARDGIELHELAARCGHTKRNRAGRRCGEGSWVARRIGLMPEGGKTAPGPFIDSRVLALIAAAVGLDPVDVEAPL